MNYRELYKTAEEAVDHFDEMYQGSGQGTQISDFERGRSYAASNPAPETGRDSYMLEVTDSKNNYSPEFRKGFLASRKEDAQRRGADAKTWNNIADMGIVGVGGLGRGAESVLQLPYNLLYYAGGKYLGLPPAGSFFEPAIEDATRDAVRNGVSPTAVTATRVTAEAIPQALAWYSAAGALSSLPGIIGPAAAVALKAEPYVTPAVQIGVEGGKAVLNSDSMRYSPLSNRIFRIPAMREEYRRLIAQGKSPEEASMQINQLRLADIQNTAASLYPNDPEKQNQFVVDKIFELVRLGAPGWNALPLADIPGKNPEEVTAATAQGTLMENTDNEMDKSVFGKIPGVRELVAWWRASDNPYQLGAELAKGKGYKNMVGPVVNTIHARLSGKAEDEDMMKGDTNSKLDRRSFALGYMGELANNQPEKFDEVLNDVASGVASKYDLDSMKEIIAKAKAMGKDINWQEFGLTNEQGGKLMMAMETGFKNRAYELWKQDILGNTPKLVGLWLRNMGVDSAIADILENPWAFYAGAFGLLLGGGALVGGLLGGGGDEAPRAVQQPVVRSPYDEGYTQFARARL